MRKKRRVKGRASIRGKREGGREKKYEERGGTNRKEKRRLEEMTEKSAGKRKEY